MIRNYLRTPKKMSKTRFSEMAVSEGEGIYTKDDDWDVASFYNLYNRLSWRRAAKLSRLIKCHVSYVWNSESPGLDSYHPNIANPRGKKWGTHVEGLNNCMRNMRKARLGAVVSIFKSKCCPTKVSHPHGSANFCVISIDRQRSHFSWCRQWPVLAQHHCWRPGHKHDYILGRLV